MHVARVVMHLYIISNFINYSMKNLEDIVIIVKELILYKILHIFKITIY